MISSIKWITFAVLVVSSNAMAAGWPEHVLSHQAPLVSGGGLPEKVACEFATIQPGEWTATFSRGWCGVEGGTLKFISGEVPPGVISKERAIELRTVRSALHHSRKRIEQLQLSMDNQIVILNVLTDDKSRKSREHVSEFWLALRKEGIRLSEGSRSIDATAASGSAS